MYTSIEKAQTYTPVFPDVRKAKKNIAGKAHRIMTVALGREFMALTARHKVYVLYFGLSFMLIFAWDEAHIWPNVLNVLNFANAVRLANKTGKETRARD